MKHKKGLILASLVTIFAMSLGLVYFFSFDDQEANVGQTELPTFINIDLDVKSANVKIVEGDGFTINYSLHGRETIKELKVEDDTLIFDTGIDFFFKPSFGNWFVEITVPHGYELNEIELNSTAGQIELKDRVFNSADLSTTAGQIIVENVVCNDLDLETVSEKIVLLESDISEGVEAKSVSGYIEISMPASTITAESIGGVNVDGIDQGYKYELSIGYPSLKAKSVSGKIIITTAE